jgi:hypothetical protein
MRPFSRSATAIALAGIAALALALWSARSGRPHTPPAPELPPEALCRLVARRVHAKELVVGELLAGKRTLFEAAALFGALNQLVPPLQDRPESAEARGAGGPTVEERLCRQVIVWVAGALSERPAEAKAVTERLEAELSEELRERGAIRLPSASSVGPVEELMARGRRPRPAREREALQPSREPEAGAGRPSVPRKRQVE